MKMKNNLIPPAMNTKKFLFSLLTIGILSGAACTNDIDEAYELSSIRRDKVVKGPKKTDKQAIRRDRVVKGPEKKS